MASIGHPCAVDPVYGCGDGLLLSNWKRGYRKGRDETERPMIDRLTLHAELLEIVHPITGEAMKFEAELPKDFAVTLKQLRRWG